MRRTLGDFAEASDGRLEGADRSYGTVSTDSRSIKPGELFVALKGPRFDGAEFVGAAATAGAAGAVVAGNAVPQARAGTLSQIVVADTQIALARAANRWRE